MAPRGRLTEQPASPPRKNISPAHSPVDPAAGAVQDAFAVAVQRWPQTGLPPSPAGWIITGARRRAIDRLRRDASRQDRHAQAALLHAVRADLLRRLGRTAEAAAEYEAAMAGTQNAAERDFLRRSREALRPA